MVCFSLLPRGGAAMPLAARQGSTQADEEVEGEGRTMGKSLCCIFCKKDWVRQVKQV
jgi:hypothetical protein